MITTPQSNPMPMPDGFVDQWHVHPWSHFKEHSWPKQCFTSPDHESESILLMEKNPANQFAVGSLSYVFHPIIYKVLYIQMVVVWVSKTQGFRQILLTDPVLHVWSHPNHPSATWHWLSGLPGGLGFWGNSLCVWISPEKRDNIGETKIILHHTLGMAPSQ